MTRSSRARGRVRSEIGDTLIEVLVAVALLGLCVVPLLGALTTSITSSSEHRSLASDDTVLRSFAEAAKYDIQLSPGALYQNCATTYATSPATAYRVVNVYPSSGPVGTALTVFGTDFAASSSVSVILAPVSGAATTISNASTVRSDGTVSATVTVPAVTVGSYSVGLSDGSDSASSATNFTVTPVATLAAGSAVSGIRVGISSIQWWNSSSLGWDSSTGTCTPNDQSDVQQITLTATDVNGVADTLSFVVTNPVYSPPHPAPTFAVTSPSNPVYGQVLTFQATLTGSNPNPNPVAPTGTITWVLTLNGTPVSSSCSSLSRQNGTNYSTTICSVSSLSLGAGVYQLTGNYAGDGNYSATAGYATTTVAPATPTVTVNVSPTKPAPGQALTFSATVTGSTGGLTPTGTVSWTFTAAPGALPTCGNSNLAGSGNSATTTSSCVVINSRDGTYVVTANYSGDSNYLATSRSSSVTVDPQIASVTLVNGGSTVRKIEQNDSIVVVYSQPMNVSSICSNWIGNSTNQSVTASSAVTVTATNGTGGANDSISVSVASTSCATFNFGTINLGSPSYVSSTVTFKGTGASASTIIWNATTNTLTITLGALTSGSTGTVASSTPVFTESTAVTDPSSQAVANSPFTLTTGPQF